MEKEFTKSDHIYFVGIGGVSMSGLAEILVKDGYNVSGSDIKTSTTTDELISKGIHIDIGHKTENITDDVTYLIYTVAISEDNPEFLEAKRRNLPMKTRGKLLGDIMRDYEYSISVSGTHGKTTTTSMISEILLSKDLDPTIAVGGVLPTIGSNLRIGDSKYFVAEACEYYNSFLDISPFIGVVLNVEEDHLDFFPSIVEIREAFRLHTLNINPSGILIINKHIDELDSIIDTAPCKVETFTIHEELEANWKSLNVVHNDNGSCDFDVYYNGEFKIKVHLNIPGNYNIANALASIATAEFLDVPATNWVEGLSHFIGTQRRFQRKGIRNGIEIIDDYAHHPTEIKATLSAVKNMKANKTWCIFQPHTYSRTKFLFNEFAESFADIDEIIITHIFPAREPFDPTITSEMLTDKIRENGKKVSYIENFSDIAKFIDENCSEGDLVLTVGAGDVYQIGEEFLSLDD